MSGSGSDSAMSRGQFISLLIGLIAILVTLFGLWFNVPTKSGCDQERDRIRYAYAELSRSFIELTKSLFQIRDVHDPIAVAENSTSKVSESLAPLAHTIVDLRQFIQDNRIGLPETDSVKAEMDLAFAIPKVLFFEAAKELPPASKVWNDVEPWLKIHESIARKEGGSRLAENYSMRALFKLLEINELIISGPDSEIERKAREAFSLFERAGIEYAETHPDKPFWPANMNRQIALCELLYAAGGNADYLRQVLGLCDAGVEGVGSIGLTSDYDEVKLWVNIAEVRLWFYDYAKARRVIKPCIEWCNSSSNARGLSPDDLHFVRANCLCLDVLCDMLEMHAYPSDYFKAPRLSDVRRKISEGKLDTADYLGSAVEIMRRIIECQACLCLNHDRVQCETRVQRLERYVEDLEPAQVASRPRVLLLMLINSVKQRGGRQFPEVQRHAETPYSTSRNGP